MAAAELGHNSGEAEMTLESMKGKPCPYKPIVCQEGYCQDCWIYLERKEGKSEQGDKKR